MGHGKETPRQKMIGMMYLVLLALLAMNVSAEILNAFILVDNSLNVSAANLDKKNDGIRTAFEKAYQLNKASVQKWKDKAEQTTISAKELVDLVSKFQKEIVSEADGMSTLYEKDGCAGISKKDDKESGTRFMITLKKGEELKKKVIAFREKMIELVGGEKEAPSLVASIKSALNTDDSKAQDGGKISWEHANFSELPLVATITMLSKLKADIKNTEGDVLNYLNGKIGADDFKFNKIEAFVNATTSSVLVGEKYTAQVFIAASDSTQDPVIVMNDGSKLKIENGKGIYEGSTGGAGIKKWGGIIKMLNPATKDTVQYKFESEYQVSPPSMSVSPTKMNVFYIGVPNPVAISAAGVASTDIQASISSGSITKVGNGYEVNVKQGPTVKVSVTAKGGKSLGTAEFRVKRVPDPVAVVGSGASKKGGPMSAGLLVQEKIRAEMENFDFDLKFNVTGFKVSVTIGGFAEEAKSSSGNFSAEQKALISKAKTGSKIIIEEVSASGPDGSVRKLNPIIIKLQ